MSPTKTSCCLAVLLVLALLAPVAEAAGLGLAMHQVDSSQFPKVRAFVSVANDQGVRIADLEQDPQAFEVLEDDKPVAGFQVEPIVASQEPVAVALVIDVSGSMNDEGKMDAAKQAASAFVDTMGPKDAGAVISFSKEVKVVQPYTADRAALKGAIGGLKPEGATLLYDAIAESATLMGSVQEQRKVMVLLTDGENELPVDRPSKNTTLDAAIAAAKNAKTPIFAVGLGSGVKRDVLDKLAAGTAGQAVYVAKAEQLRQVFLNLGDQLRRQYVISYTSKLPGDDKQHTLTVKTKYRGQTGEAKGTFVAKGAPPPTATALPKPTVAPTLVPTPKPTAAPTAAPTVPPTVAAVAKPTVVQPTPTPTPPPADNTLLYAAAGAGVLVVIGGATAAFLLLRRKPAPPPPPAAQPVYDDRTEAIGISPLRMPPADAGATMVSAGGMEGTVVSGPPPPPPRPRGRLHIVHQGTERDVVLEQPETILGREPTNPVAIKDPLASRRHAKITIENGEFWIEDLKSLNGTRVNGEVITRHKLANNDQIKIGDATITFTGETH